MSVVTGLRLSGQQSSVTFSRSLYFIEFLQQLLFQMATRCLLDCASHAATPSFSA